MNQRASKLASAWGLAHRAGSGKAASVALPKATQHANANGFPFFQNISVALPLFVSFFRRRSPIKVANLGGLVHWKDWHCTSLK
jgi:hypothetical protein